MDLATEPQASEPKDYVGVGAKDLKIDIENGQAVVSGAIEHVGKYGSVELSIKGKLETAPVVEKLVKPILDKVIDGMEKAIPGDQKALAESLKVLVDQEIKKLLEKV